MLTKRQGGGFVAGHLDCMMILCDPQSGRFHATVAEDANSFPREDGVQTAELQSAMLAYKLHHTAGAPTLPEAQDHLAELRRLITIADTNVYSSPLMWPGLVGDKFRVTVPNWRMAGGSIEKSLLAKFRPWVDNGEMVDLIRTAHSYDGLAALMNGTSPLAAASYAIARGVEDDREFWECRARLHLLLDQLLIGHLVDNGREVAVGIARLKWHEPGYTLCDDEGCEGCRGGEVPGVRADATAHAGPPPEGFVVVERCDTCERFATDLQAAKAWGLEAREQQGNGTTQTIAKPRPTAAV